MFLPTIVCSTLTLPHQTDTSHTKKETVVLEPTTPFILSRLFFTVSASHECLTANWSSNSEFKINRINQSIGELEFKIGETHSDLCRLQISLCSLLVNWYLVETHASLWETRAQESRSLTVAVIIRTCKRLGGPAPPLKQNGGCPAPTGSPDGDAHTYEW